MRVVEYRAHLFPEVKVRHKSLREGLRTSLPRKRVGMEKWVILDQHTMIGSRAKETRIATTTCIRGRLDWAISIGRNN